MRIGYYPMTEKSFQVFSTIQHMTSKKEVATALAKEISRFSIYDLGVISASLEHEINLLPSPYRERIQPHFREQYFGRYFKIMSLHSNDGLDKLKGDINDINLFCEYCNMVLERFNVEGTPERDKSKAFAPFQGLFYYLISSFMMFVLSEPGHPIGMPFPGGFTVRESSGIVYCPVRDKEKDVPYSICNYCPAKQDDLP